MSKFAQRTINAEGTGPKGGARELLGKKAERHFLW